MALIPSDVGLRMRLDNEILPQQVAPVQEIAADLPPLRTGQTFTAQIREVLPEKTYLALVGGKTVTLSLPEAVKSGDILELVVIDRTPRAIVAQRAEQPAGAGNTTATPQTSLTRTGQMLGALLSAEGEAPPAAPLNRGQPLLTQPPRSGAELAPVLNKAVAASGLFYESHQAQWVFGKRPLESLLQEPQGRQPASAPALLRAALASSLATTGAATASTTGMPATQIAAPALLRGAAETTTTSPGTGAGARAPGPPPASNASLAAGAPEMSRTTLHGLLLYRANQAMETPGTMPSASPHAQTGTAGADETATAATPNHATPAAGTPTTAQPESARHAETAETARSGNPQLPLSTQPAIPDELLPLVQQQLDAAGSQRLLWHGEVWPGQTMQWQVEWDGPDNGSADQAEPWTTSLRLVTPRLGEIEASLKLGGNGVRIALVTPHGASAEDLRIGAAELEQSLAAAGIHLHGFTVRQSTQE